LRARPHPPTQHQHVDPFSRDASNNHAPSHNGHVVPSRLDAVGVSEDAMSLAAGINKEHASFEIILTGMSPLNVSRQSQARVLAASDIGETSPVSCAERACRMPLAALSGRISRKSTSGCSSRNMRRAPL
jgi:hypothetical protein